MTASKMPPRRGVSAAWTAVTVARPIRATSVTTAHRLMNGPPRPSPVDCFRSSGSDRNRFLGGRYQEPRNLSTRASCKGGPGAASSVLGQPDVLELLVGVVIGRRDIVLHLRPVHHAARPPEAGNVVRVFEHDLLDLVDEPLPLGRVEGPRLARKEVVDAGIGEATPVVGVPGGVTLEEQVGVVHIIEYAVDDDLEVPPVAPVREPGRGFEGPVLGLDPDLAPLLDHEHAEVDVRNPHVTILQDHLEAVGIARLG